MNTKSLFSNQDVYKLAVAGSTVVVGAAIKSLVKYQLEIGGQEKSATQSGSSRYQLERSHCLDHCKQCSHRVSPVTGQKRCGCFIS